MYVNSVGMYDIVYDTGASLAVQGILAFDNVNLKTWSRYLERLDEEFIKRSGTWNYILYTVFTLYIVYSLWTVYIFFQSVFYI